MTERDSGDVYSAEGHRVHTAPGSRRLRYGIMCRGPQLEAWQALVVRELQSIPEVEPALLIVDADAGAAGPRHRLWQRLRSPSLLWNLYQRAFIAGKIPAERRMDLPAELDRGLPVIRCRPEFRGKYSQYFSPEDVSAIRAHDLDFILRFAFNIIRGDILSAARYGVWSFHHGDLDRYRGMPCAFWEIAKGDPVTGITLQRLTDALDSGIVLKQCHIQTVPKSYARSREAVLVAGADLPAKVCRDLLSNRGEYVSAQPSRTTAPIFRTPKNSEMLSFLARTTTAKLTDAAGWLFRHRQWGVGIIHAPIHSFLDPRFRPEVSWLPRSDRRHFLADPFGIRSGKNLTILAEELDHAEQVGRVVAIECPEVGAPRIRRGILELAVHASYPYLVEHDGEIFCMPETSASEQVVLYKAVDFPTRWEKVATLVQGIAALDASLVRFDGRWWMFYGVEGTAGTVTLHAMHAPDLRGPWMAHAANPLKMDVRSTRPGGTPFVHQGTLYRPAQDCSRGYGGAVALNRVTRLSPVDFHEEVVTVVRPDPHGPFPAGLHTLSAAGDKTIIDGQRTLFVPALFFAQLRKMLRSARASSPWQARQTDSVTRSG